MKNVLYTDFYATSVKDKTIREINNLYKNKKEFER